VFIPPNTKFTAIDGYFRTLDDYLQQEQEGYGGYAHYITKNKILDGYTRCIQGLSLGSKANSGLNLHHAVTKEKARNNATFVYNKKIQLGTLKSKNAGISPHTEIHYSYGASYKLYTRR
jgi:hypothetical protein